LKIPPLIKENFSQKFLRKNQASPKNGRAFLPKFFEENFEEKALFSI
jgi:hypothetical protein